METCHKQMEGDRKTKVEFSNAFLHFRVSQILERQTYPDKCNFDIFV